MHRHGLLPALASLIAFTAPAQAPQTPTAPTAARPELRQFTNLNRSFHIDVPATWRQLAPNEARQLVDNPAAPPELGYVEPRMLYAVGPVDRWLAGDFTSPWLYVVEQGHEWFVEEDFAQKLTDSWHERGKATGTSYTLTDIRTAKVGPGNHAVRLAVRTSQPKNGRATKSLDVYAPAGGQQFTLSMTCEADQYDQQEPEFQRWLQTLAFARPSRGEQTLTDRMWTPILTSGLVGLVLLVLYKHTRGKR